MKKTTTTLLFILLITYYSFSQDKGYVAISLGPSIPIGDFASTDLNNSSSGLAKTGAIFDITFAYKLGTNMGLTAMLRGQSNPVDNQSLLDQLNREDPTISWRVDSKNWGIGGFMFGGYGSFAIATGKTSFEWRAMIGFLSASSPDLTLSGTQNGISAWAKLNSTTSTSFAYLIGAGFKFNVGAKICLLTNLDYMGSSAEFKNARTTNSAGTFSEETISQKFGTINFGIGIGLRL